MAENETSLDDPLASFDASGSPQETPSDGDSVVSDPLASADESANDEVIVADEPQESESVFASQAGKSFSTLGDEQADISEYQDVPTAQAVEAPKKEVSLEDRVVQAHAISKIALAILILVCLVFIADGYAKSSPDGSPLLRLPFFVQGNLLCNRTNGGFDMDGLLRDTEFLAVSGNQDIKARYDAGDCFSRSELTEVYEARKKYLEESTAAALREILPKKFTFVSFSESPLFRFIQSQSPDRRAGQATLITSVLDQVEKIDELSDTALLCQRISFEEKIATVSCIARGRASISSRDVIITFLDALKKQPNIVFVDYPDSIELRQLDPGEAYDTESSIDLHLIQRSSGYETEVLPLVD